jgi:dienelactone hydrolase
MPRERPYAGLPAVMSLESVSALCRASKAHTPMKKTLMTSLGLAFVLAASFLSAAEKIDLERTTPVPANQPIPIQDFFRPRALAQPIINRGGTHIAAIAAADEDKHFLMVYDIASTKVETLGFNAEKDIYNVYWLNDSRLLFQISSRKQIGLGIMVAAVGRLKSPYPLQQYNGSSLVSIPLKDPEHPLIWNRYHLESQRDVGVVAVNSSLNNLRMIDLSVPMNDVSYMQAHAKTRDNNDRAVIRSYPTPPEPSVTYGYMADKEGQLAYAFTAQQGVLSMFRLEQGKWTRCEVDLEQVTIVDNADLAGQLLVVGPPSQGKPQPLQYMDAATGQLGGTLLEDENYDFNGWTYNNPATGDVLGVVFQKGTRETHWFSRNFRSLQKSLDGMFPNQVASIIGNDDKQQVFLVATYSDRHPVAYHWVNLAARKAGLFKNSAPWINPARMQPMQVMPFTTRDGYRLDSYLTLPAGATKENPAPLVVLCHGGPWVRDTWGFDGEAQFLASRGYAVLQPNYRGSTGSAGRFPATDRYDFIKMHHDVTDAVKTAIGTGLIDQGRIGIMGASFGGYLAVSGVAHEPNLYRCAVTNAGVFDWALQVQSEKYDQYDLPYYGRMIKTLGDPRVEAAKYEAMSPIRYVANIKVPVFVAGGKDDDVVELQQSRKLLDEFDRNHVTYEKLFFGGEGHGTAHLANTVELYGRIEAFLAKNLMPKR